MGKQEIREHEALRGGFKRRLYCRLISFSRSLQTLLRINLDGTAYFAFCVTRMSNTRQKINLCFRLLQCKEFTLLTRITAFTNLEGNPVQSKYPHRISLQTPFLHLTRPPRTYLLLLSVRQPDAFCISFLAAVFLPQTTDDLYTDNQHEKAIQVHHFRVAYQEVFY